MKTVISDNGLATKLSEETSLKPKPMVEIGSYPILWHIMKVYSCHEINEFVIFCVHKGHVIKEYFKSYLLNLVDVIFYFKNGSYVMDENNAQS
jgi:glucose-1-phosphate cytidylyltransferase